MSQKLLATLSEEELLNLCQPTECASCGEKLHEGKTGMRKVDGKCYCSDCYFQDFSTEVEVHPIGIPRMHRAR